MRWITLPLAVLCACAVAVRPAIETALQALATAAGAL